MTAPLVPVDADLRDFHFMPLDVARLVNSDVAALASGDEFKAAVMLWCHAWHQKPASSLPDDDRMLCRLAGYGRDIKGWRKVKDVALRGFVRCDDGRLYHPVIAEKVIEALEAKRKQRERTANATKARLERANANDEQRNVERNDQRNVNRNVHQGTGTGTEINIDDGRIARATFEQTETAIRTIPEIGAHPVGVNAVIAPIFQLVQRGFSLDTQIIPSIRRQLISAKRPVKSWAYFVDGIVNDAEQITTQPAGGRTHGSYRHPSPAQQLRDAIADVQAAVADRDTAA